ncbi:MAG: hypothetical protein ACOYKM_03020 [Caulobacterales bacterium]|jgi:hypothetical protein
MTNVVVSYASQDAGRARLVVQKLAALGFGVVETGLEAPSPTTMKRIILWSKTSEASLALRPGPEAVVIARLDPVTPPLLRGATRINLQAWSGRADHRGWQALLQALAPTHAGIAGNAPARIITAPAQSAAPAMPAPAEVPAESQPAIKSGSGWLIALLALVGLGAGAAAAVYFLR